MKKERQYKRSHPWLTFSLNLKSFPASLWMLLGEARSKCDHIAGVPLKPYVADQLHQLYLSKGAHATTAIEGNTLTEKEVLLRVQGKLQLPPSREYLGREVDNVVEALNQIGTSALHARDARLSSAEISDYNRLVLDGLELESGVIPGAIRTYSVGVGRYLGAPAQDCEYLLGEMCSWLNNSDFTPANNDAVVYGLIRAVLAHLYIAWIHPYGDGNGRTARLVEFKILVSAGVPTPAAHLLSNHYNETRSEYYKQLDYASESNGDLIPFFTYAISGFIEGLQAQLQGIRDQQWTLAWRDYVHTALPGDDDKVVNRQRHLVLDLADRNEPVPTSKLREISPRVAQDYALVADRTFLRDLSHLTKLRLVTKGKIGVRANREVILAFLPDRRDLLADSVLPFVVDEE